MTKLGPTTALLVLVFTGGAAAAAELPKAQIQARVSDDLGTVSIRARFEVPFTDIEVVLPAERYRRAPDPLPPHAERELFRGGLSFGGFDAVAIQVDGAPCAGTATTAADGSALIRCAAGGAGVAVVEVQAELTVPDRHGPFSRSGRQLTLGGGWFPVVQRAGGAPLTWAFDVSAEVPAGVAVALGDRFDPARPMAPRRAVRWSGVSRQVPLVVLPPWTGTRPAAKGRARFVSASVHRPGDATAALRIREVRKVLDDGLAFLDEVKVDRPRPGPPLLVVEAPLRHDLARVCDGLVLVSDRAFRLTPHERFLKFHRYPLLRAIYGAWFLRGRVDDGASFAADAVAASLVDRYVRARTGGAEDAFDVLSLWSFIPAVDSLLYAPQLPFVGAYFRLIQEQDNLRANLVDPPSTRPPGKIAYEKLLDAFGAAKVQAVLTTVARGAPLESAVSDALGEAGLAVLGQWTGDYPAVQYRLTDWASRPAPASRCGRRTGPCHVATVTVERTGAAIAEPLFVRLEDDDGEARTVVMTSTSARFRTVTATLGAELDLVVLDPSGRFAEAPSEAVPSPKFDNRSRPRWRFLLNSFNVLYSPSAGNLDTALDVGFSRVRDVRWRFAARASYAPEAITLSTRGLYRFGQPVTPDSLAQWVGVVVGGEYLRPEFAGTEQSALALSTALFYGYDDRRTAWAPEAGLGLRASLGVSHVFGDPSDDSDVTRDAVNLTVRALRSWRVGGAHQLSVRASAGAYLVGTPRPQLRYALGGRRNLRGYVVDDEVGRLRALASAEWVHPLLSNMDLNAAWLVWVTDLDGALYADVAVIGDDLSETFTRTPRADVGYGVRLYLDYFGVRPGVMAVDVAWPLVDDEGRFRVGPPAVYIDFAQSFFAF